jgi:hypothetical protein
MKISRTKLRQIIREEFSRSSIAEYTTYSSESPAGKGEVSKSTEPTSSPSKKSAQPDEDIEGYVDELPVNLTKTQALARQDSEIRATQSAERVATSPGEKADDAQKIGDLVKTHDRLALSEIHGIFESEGLSVEERISALESLLSVLFSKDASGAGYLDKFTELSKEVEKIKQSVQIDDESRSPLVDEKVI